MTGVTLFQNDKNVQVILKYIFAGYHTINKLIRREQRNMHIRIMGVAINWTVNG